MVMHAPDPRGPAAHRDDPAEELPDLGADCRPRGRGGEEEKFGQRKYPPGRKQVSCLLAPADYLALRAHSVQTGTAMGEIVAGWIAPRLAKLRDAAAAE